MDVLVRRIETTLSIFAGCGSACTTMKDWLTYVSEGRQKWTSQSSDCRMLERRPYFASLRAMNSQLSMTAAIEIQYVSD